jgi:hypothetical protein
MVDAENPAAVLLPSWAGVPAVVPAGLAPPNSPAAGAAVVVGAGVPAAGAVVDAGFGNRLVAAAGVDELGAAVAAGVMPNEMVPAVAELEGAVVVGAAVLNKLGAAAADEAAGAVVVWAAENKDLGAVVAEVVGAGVLEGVVPAVIPKSCFAPVAGAVEAVPGAGAAGAAPLNSEGVPDAAGVVEGFGPKRPVVPAVAAFPGCAVGAGFWANIFPTVAAGAAGLDPRPAPNKLTPVPAGLDVSAGGAPAGVVDPSPPNVVLAGVA